MSSKPEVSIPAEDAPTELVIEDLIVGTGDEAKAGRNVDVHYVGVAWSTGKQFDASWDRNETFEFRLGAGQVIHGTSQSPNNWHGWIEAAICSAGGLKN